MREKTHYSADFPVRVVQSACAVQIPPAGRRRMYDPISANDCQVMITGLSDESGIILGVFSFLLYDQLARKNQPIIWFQLPSWIHRFTL